MTCAHCRDQLPALVDGTLDLKAASALRLHLETCPECTREYATLTETLAALDAVPSAPPSHRLRAGVAGLIETEKLTLRSQAAWAQSIRTAAEARPARRHGWLQLIFQVAGACAVLFLGFFMGERNATQRQLVEQSVLQKKTTGDRLETVLTAATTRVPDERVIDGLINSMAFDPSVNVRLNALTGLYAHADQEVVRAGVLACLPREANPLVQVSMIDFLVASKAREANPLLKKMAADDKVDADVRESARRAVELL
jgi:anti-sigma factor RsiW